MTTLRKPIPKRKDDRIIIHFDYDCFYASVFEVANPLLKSLPLGVQQKQILVTCNYEARRRGLHKLQRIADAKQICPDVVIVPGEQLDRVRDASKTLHKLLAAFSWSGRVEKLGFDEVFMDVTDIVDYNRAVLNPNDLQHAFFNLDREDPTVGFLFDASITAGHEYPESSATNPTTAELTPRDTELLTRLRLGSHLAQHLRLRLEEEAGYTSTVGISTSKLLAKLAGNVHKPRGQTTLLPPYESVACGGDPAAAAEESNSRSNVTEFMDAHDIAQIPGIGSAMARKIRNHILPPPAAADADDPVFGAKKPPVSARAVRLFPGMGPDVLEQLLGGAGAERGIGAKAWALVHGVDDSEVQKARAVPSQISIEDSYGTGLETLAEVQRELRRLCTSLVRRMRADLLEDEDWLARPKTLRLSTRPRRPDGAAPRSVSRVSRSCALPSYVFELREGVEAVGERLVHETLLPLFRRLHGGRGWRLGLMNVCVANMAETASPRGRHIGQMFEQQVDVLREWRVEDRDVPPEGFVTGCGEAGGGWEGGTGLGAGETGGSEDVLPMTQEEGQWRDEEEEADCERCGVCGASMPMFAMAAHGRYHMLGH